jgi:hypothetical protein
LFVIIRALWLKFLGPLFSYRWRNRGRDLPEEFQCLI